MYYQCFYHSPLGLIRLTSDGKYLIGLWFENQKYIKKAQTGTMIQDNQLEVFQKTKKWLDDYFANKRPNILDVPLKPEGTPFQKAVWNILMTIPYGKTITYKEIAIRLKKEKASQAVGNAVGHNPISIIIPCHRVIGANGKLTGYAGGLDKKAFLLHLEQNKI